MRFNASNAPKAALTAVAAASVLMFPTTASAAAVSAPGVDSTGVSINSIDSTCKHHSRNYIVRTYYRGPGKYVLRCGTARWGWKHIKKGHGWNGTMDRKIRSAIWSGRPNGRGGYSTYTQTCPSVEKFRTILGTPAGTNDVLTAYKVNTLAGARC
ncbi:hypothetical protein [Streptomyces sp. NPDC058045]|uniref:hypothetical protein n=1 Tax=Streptomyces sp. NPDC058045 TaxID=3346311 RepID=UPI0036E2D5CB